MNFSTRDVSLAIAALAVLGGIYWYFFTGSSAPPLSVSTASGGDQAAFQSLLGELSPITFNTAIFSDPRFTALSDLSTPVIPEAAGRLDPFAPTR